MGAPFMGLAAPPVGLPVGPPPAVAPRAPAANAAKRRQELRRAQWKLVEHVCLQAGRGDILEAAAAAPTRAAVDLVLSAPTLAMLPAAVLDAAGCHRNSTNSSVAARKRRAGIAGAPPARRPPRA